MNKRITLRDIARHCGVSLATASLALRDSPKLAGATRERVRRAARELGYQYDPMLAALAAHRWNRRGTNMGGTLALLANGGIEGEKGMRDRATDHGYKLEVFQLGDYPDPKRLADVMYHRGILGVLVAQISTPGFCEAFDWSRFISVACSEGSVRPPCHLVMPNHFQAVQEAWDRAWAAGHRRIGLAIFNEPLAIDYRERCAAFLERQRQADESQRISILGVSPQVTDAKGYNGAVQAMKAWLRQWKPDIVLGFNDMFYWLVRDAAGKNTPQVAFYNLWITRLPSLCSGLFLPVDEIGRRAVDFLDSQIRAGERGIPHPPATLAYNLPWQEASAKPGAKIRRPRLAKNYPSP